MHKMVIDCGSALKKLNRLHNRENISLSNPWVYLPMHPQSFWNKVRKEIARSNILHPSLDLQVLTQSCSLLYSPSEITMIDVGPHGKPHTQASHSSWLHLTGHSLIGHMHAMGSGAPKTVDYNAQRHHEQWHLVLPAAVVYIIIWLHANGGKHFQNLYSSSRSLFIGRDLGHSRMWVLWTRLTCFIVHRNL